MSDATIPPEFDHYAITQIKERIVASSTKIHGNIAHRSLQGLALTAIERMGPLSFRHHGIGVLQGYISEGTEPELRLHIWSPLLMKAGIDQSGNAHDHRFDMTSHVLLGSIVHDEIHPCELAEGDWGMMSLTHARAAADTAYHGPTTAIAGRFSFDYVKHTIFAGHSYQFPAGMFHRSPLSHMGEDEVAVTVIEKANTNDRPARIFYPLDKPPVMAFGHVMDPGLVAHVIDMARSGLCRALAVPRA